ncbi:MAG: nucleoside-diphosphate kinase [Kiritimatiellia bacterium]
MDKELAFVLINPYTIAKSRTGGVIARYICRSDLSLVAARMYGPCRKLVDEYSELIRNAKTDDPQTTRLIADYIRDSYAPDPSTGKPQRVMLLLFEGEDAVRKIWKVTGSATLRWGSGETIRDTYGDYITDKDGNVQYFEPAVLVGPTKKRTAATLKLWARHSKTDGGIIDSAIDVPAEKNTEKTLVLIKPDNFRFPSARPGNIIDFLSSSGLRIVAVKKLTMTVAQAENFYGPVRESLKRKFAENGAERAAGALSREFGFSVPQQSVETICESLGPVFAQSQFEDIVEFMAGCKPSECTEHEKPQTGKGECLALVYEGADAVNIIRNIVGMTDPSRARPGSVRREFGSDVMVNAAHASDSIENAVREMNIINITEDGIEPLVSGYYGKKITQATPIGRFMHRFRSSIINRLRQGWQSVKA